MESLCLVCVLGLDLSSIVELGFGRTAKDLAMVLLLGNFGMVLWEAITGKL